MKYERILKGTFIDRPNRFVAHVMLQGQEVVCHVKNTGRCRELLIPGAVVYLQESNNPARKTRYDLIAVEKGKMLVNMDSQIPNAVVEEWIREGHFLPNITCVKREKTYGNSRFDLYVEQGERKIFIEVKGVTLEEDGIARFPDAPTLRGVKHIQELSRCLEEGYEAYIIFVIQMEGISGFEPNWKTQEEFGENLRQAREAGVHVLAYDCRVTPESIVLNERISVML